MNQTNPFDQSAATWDAEPRRVRMTNDVGQAILSHAKPTPEMDVLDYGCGTGLIGLFLLPHVRSVTGADNSLGMLQVLEGKIQSANLTNMHAVKLDLESDPIPQARYHLIVTNMVMHHTKKTDVLLSNFYQMLHPGGQVAIADLDSEPGNFHRPDTTENVYHHGFDRGEFIDSLHRVGFTDTSHTTAHIIQKPIATGEMRDFPVFLIVGRRQ